MSKQNWLFINTKRQSAAYNMALDEVLLNNVSKGNMPPVIRFYQWEKPSLSIGYFQRIHRDIDVDMVHQKGYDLVRRATGGRGVLHDKELTYSVIVPEDYDGMPKTVNEAYKVISQGLLEGFKKLGLDAEFSVPTTVAERVALKDTQRSAVCFDASSWYELVVEGRKVAGSAQTRQKGVILQHGSILLDLDIDDLFDMFIYKSDRIKSKMKDIFKTKAVAINDLTDHSYTIEDLEESFYKGFQSGLSIQCTPFELTDELKDEVKELEKVYASEEWTYRR